MIKTDYPKLFEQNKYVHLPDFLDEQNCVELTQILKGLVEQGQTTKDSQCPKSEAIHGNITFDTLLNDLTPHFETACGKKLYPTYSYARLYKPGETLTIHSDRPACEISVTLTLGFKGKKWPIFMADPALDGEKSEKYNSKGSGQFKDIKVKNISKITMNVGDAVLYRGQEKIHWREEFEGEWQAQVFLHYVDQDGPHADQKYDGRESLGIPKPSNNTQQAIQRVITNVAVFENHLTEKFCKNIIKEYSKKKHTKLPPVIGGNDGQHTGTIDREVRDVHRLMLPQNQGIGGILTSTALNANHYWWKYNITHSNQTEFLMYEPDGHYNSHVDTFHVHSDETRKLTVLAFLNDDYEGGKFWVNANGNPFYPPQEPGTVIVFPSYMVHGVEPVTKGVRYSVVTWMVGPYFK